MTEISGIEARAGIDRDHFTGHIKKFRMALQPYDLQPRASAVLVVTLYVRDHMKTVFDQSLVDALGNLPQGLGIV